MKSDFPDKFGIPRQSGLVDGLYGKVVFEKEYAVPEAVFGEDFMAEAYREDPAASKARVYAQLRAICPEAGEKQIKKLLGDP